MKFLVMIDDSKQSVENAFVQLEQQQRWFGESKSNNAVESIYSLAGMHGVVMMIEVGSLEELDEVLISMPAACHGSGVKVYPLADYGAATKRLSAQFSKMASAMKAERTG